MDGGDETTGRGYLAAVVPAALAGGGIGARAADGEAAGKAAVAPQTGVMTPVELPAQMPGTADGWTDPMSLLVPGDDGRSLGDESRGRRSHVRAIWRRCWR